ncbi:Protein of unknown function [Gryllus bimaculatus]|nr:Protein of unknown function [Gryllus bimaculatus]
MTVILSTKRHLYSKSGNKEFTSMNLKERRLF